MMVKKIAAAIALAPCLAAFGFVEPIYTVTTFGEGTNSLDSATVKVTLGGETSEVAFSGLSLAGNDALVLGWRSGLVITFR